ncbi:MAG: fused MFS/spermidine synthase [Planctomycetes bacterium]|nr:fused MFS/spermidine synthase [Planctomycetota bacterium]
MSDTGSSPWALRPILFLSGAAALVYEVTFLRLLSPCFGGDARAVAAVVAAFFAGMGIGALAAGRIAARSRRPLRLYAWMEIGAAATALAAPLALGWIEAAVGGASSDGVRFGFAFLLLVVPAALLGGTLPAAAAAAREERLAKSAGSLYAWNTAGGALGAALAGFLLMPALGTRLTLGVGAAASVMAGVAALALDRRASAAPTSSVGYSAAKPAKLALLAYGLGGMVALADEVLWSRAFAQFFQNSVYSFAIVLALFLLGIALGSAVVSAIERRMKRPATWGALVQSTIAAWTIFTIYLFRRHLEMPRADATSFGATVAYEATFAAAVIALPTLLFGAFFPIALRLAGERGAPARPIGALLGVNTLAGVVGALGAGFVLLPALGLRNALVATGGASLAISAILAWRTQASIPARLVLFAVPATLVGILATSAPTDLRVWLADPGETLVDYREGPDANVAVVRSVDGSMRLRTNFTFSQGGGEGLLIERRQALLPVLLHPSAKRALVLGLGTGNTAGALSRFPDLQVDVVEILPSVVELSRRFAATNFRVHDDPRVRIRVDDAVSFVRFTKERYDLVIGDLFHPGERGAGALFTLEHFQEVRRALAPGGLFCQWLPLHQLSPEEVAVIEHTFLEAFPLASLWIAYPHALSPIAALVGSESALSVDVAALAARTKSGDAALLHECGLDLPEELLALHVADAPALARAPAIAAAATATRDRPTIEFSSPRKEALRPTFPEANLVSLVALWSSPARIASGADDATKRRLDAFSEATRRLVRGHLFRMQRLRTTGRDEVAQLFHREMEEYSAALGAECDYRYLSIVVTDLVSQLVADSRVDEALALAQRAVDSCPNVFAFRLQLGRLFTKLLDSDSAIRELRRAVELDPRSPVAHAYLGVNLFAAERRDEAIAELEKARALDDTDLLIWKPLGLLYFERGDRDKAKEALQRARTIDPSDRDVQQKLDALERR